MNLGWRRPVSFVNGRIVTEAGQASSMRVDTRVRAFDEPPHRTDVVIDLDGAFVLPGLINAHDHLELNHYGSFPGSGLYTNASEWIADMRPRLQGDASIRANSAYPLKWRLFIGGLKNLLAGVTLVAHHNPLYRDLRGVSPSRVLQRFGWAHSLAMEGQPVGANGEPGPDVAAAFRATPQGAPFLVHAAEGTNARAAAEITRLESAGCLRSPTILIHGLAMDVAHWRTALNAGLGLVWCPASNLAMFGRTIPAREFLDAAPWASQHLCLGTDSRLTGARDLLDELRVAADASSVTADELLQMVTSTAASVLRAEHAGRLAVGGPADFIVVSPLKGTAADSLLASTRADLACVAIDGEPVVAAPSFKPFFDARRVPESRATVDGATKILSHRVARTIARCPIAEPGLAAVVQTGRHPYLND